MIKSQQQSARNLKSILNLNEVTDQIHFLARRCISAYQIPKIAQFKQIRQQLIDQIYSQWKKNRQKRKLFSDIFLNKKQGIKLNQYQISLQKIQDHQKYFQIKKRIINQLILLTYPLQELTEVRNIKHNDIKIDNIIFHQLSKELQLIDFNLSFNKYGHFYHQRIKIFPQLFNNTFLTEIRTLFLQKYNQISIQQSQQPNINNMKDSQQFEKRIEIFKNIPYFNYDDGIQFKDSRELALTIFLFIIFHRVKKENLKQSQQKSINNNSQILKQLQSFYRCFFNDFLQKQIKKVQKEQVKRHLNQDHYFQKIHQIYYNTIKKKLDSILEPIQNSNKRCFFEDIHQQKNAVQQALKLCCAVMTPYQYQRKTLRLFRIQFISKVFKLPIYPCQQYYKLNPNASQFTERMQFKKDIYNYTLLYNDRILKLTIQNIFYLQNKQKDFEFKNNIWTQLDERQKVMYSLFLQQTQYICKRWNLTKQFLNQSIKQKSHLTMNEDYDFTIHDHLKERISAQSQIDEKRTKETSKQSQIDQK